MGVMYNPPHFAEPRQDVLVELIRQAHLGELITLGPDGLLASTIPLLWEVDGEHGRLVGHLARANQQWRTTDANVEALVIFRTVDAYVSPSYYASKAEHGKVVPTWNYVSVHARGPLVIHDDRDWVRALVSRLTDHHEEDRDMPWSIDDAPTDFIDKQLAAIVGIEIPITVLEGKQKLSQNRPVADIEGVVAGLQSRTPSDQAAARAVIAANLS
jgi:transcriptional regulator